MKNLRDLITLSLTLPACASQPSAEVDRVKALIQASLDRGARATIVEDIDAYMAELPPDLSIADESGEIITRDEQRAYVLRDWSVIERTVSLTQRVDTLEVNGATADVITSQRWERLMQRPDRPSRSLHRFGVHYHRARPGAPSVDGQSRAGVVPNSPEMRPARSNDSGSAVSTSRNVVSSFCAV
jgi:hypothetical protein